MKEYLRLLLILATPLLLVSVYSVSGHRLVFNGWTMSKIHFWQKLLASHPLTAHRSPIALRRIQQRSSLLIP